MTEFHDQELLELFGDESRRNYGFNLLVTKYQRKVYWQVRRIIIDHDDANDVVQNTFIKVWKGLSGFRQDSNLYTWIYRIAANESLTFLKQQKKRMQVSIDDEESNVGDTLKADTHYEGNKMQLKLQEAIATLPDKQKLVFTMKYFDDLKYEELSEILGTSVGALKASYHLAVKKIEEFLKKDS